MELARWVFVLVIVSACGGTPSPTVLMPRETAPEVPAETPAGGDDSSRVEEVASVPYSLPSNPAPVATKRVCASQATTPKSSIATSQQKLKTFDFVGDTVEPLPYGPRASEMRYLDRERPEHALDSAMRHLTPHMNACYRWVRFRGTRAVELAPTYQVAFTIGPLGDVTDVLVQEEHSKEKAIADLAHCVGEGLRAMRVVGSTTQTTRVRGRISFVKSGLGRPEHRSERPHHLLPPSIPPTACTAVPATGVTANLELGQLATFDDWDQAHQEWEEDEAQKRYRKRHPNEPRSERPQRHIACVHVSPALNKEQIRGAIQADLGALRTCYRDLLQSDPDAAGTSVATFSLGFAGVPDTVQASGTHPGLNACVEASILQLKLPTLVEWRAQIRYPFTFQAGTKVPELPRAALPLARTLLARGDADQAAENFAQVIRSSGGGADECLGRIGVLEAMLAKAPWVLDERVRIAAADLARHASEAKGRDTAGACLEQAAALTNRVATWPLSFDSRGWRYPPHVLDVFPESGSIVTRVQALLRDWPSHPNRMELQILLAREQVRSGLLPDARETLQSLAASKLEDRQARRVLELYTEAAKPRAEREVYRTNYCGVY